MGRRGLEDFRRGLEDVRGGLEDFRAGLEDFRGGLEDIRRDPRNTRKFEWKFGPGGSDFHSNFRRHLLRLIAAQGIDTTTYT